MNDKSYDIFFKSEDTLLVYEDDELIFSSIKDGLLPLVEYLDEPETRNRQVTIYDKVTGNAAALLSVIAGCTCVRSPLGSGIAAATLEKHNIEYHFGETVPYIQKPDSEEMCPMEKLSLGKEPDEFYKALIERLR